jgi:hypothetical protein
MQLNGTRILSAWARAPLMGKVMFMARMLVDGEQALTAVCKLIALVLCMASMMSAEERIAIAEQLRQEADALCPPPDRRALH